jgi:hypothetical protein
MDLNLILNVPTPKQRKQTTRDDRLRIQTLYYNAGFTPDQIVLQLHHLTLRQVEYALSHPLTPKKKACGRKPFLSTPRRKLLIDWVCASKVHRRIPWDEIPEIFGWDCGFKAIQAAFKKEGFARRNARTRPPISEKNRILRLEFAKEHVNWTDEQWAGVLWSDETWAKPGKHKKTKITRRIGPSELFHPDCVEPYWQRKIGWMFWGCISGRYGKGIHLFWEKSWGNINLASYCEHVLPLLKEYMQSHPGLVFQQDNAGAHAAAATTLRFLYHGIHPIKWPPYSPDLNPIETVWDWLKDYIEVIDPSIYRSYQKLRAVILQAWDAIDNQRVLELVSGASMRARCQAVIDANGMNTKY